MLKFVGFLSLFFSTTFSFGQTLIMNEVSNGPAGNQEYVEFVVVSDAVTYDCNSSAPPCIDIRGWIFDDNSGFHSVGEGVAPGAVRFANVPFWSCLPLGTIIVIYNNAETNTTITGPDVSMADGNCRLIVPLNDPAYFEFNGTTPGDVACSYPGSGWGTDSSPTWLNNTALANSGDCARIVDLSGCEVFSVCYAAADSNTLIYFASGGSGTDNVWYFNNGDPSSQINWSEGCADPSTCGSNMQTPGAPNNPANAAYIAQFNNGCVPITPVAVSALVDNHQLCGCDGQATASGSGSIGPYTYEWFDNSMVPIAQNTATATGLCPGTYFVTVTSSINCDITQSITINSGSSTPVFTTSILNPASCGASDGSITLNGLLPSTGYSLSYSDGGTAVGPLSITSEPSGSYIISGLNAGGYSNIVITSGTCSSAPASASLSDPTSPVFTVSLGANPITCFGTEGAIHIEGSGSLMPSTVYVLTYTDNGSLVGPANITTDVNGDFNIAGLNAGSYSAFILNLAGCVGTQSGPITLVDPTPPTATAGTTTPTICSGSSINLTANTIPGSTYSWTGPNSFISSAEDPVIASATTAASGTYILTITLNNCVSLPSNVTVTVNATPVLSVTNPAPVCTPSTVDLTAVSITTGSTNIGSLSYWQDGGATVALSTPEAIATGGTYYIQATNAGCTDIEPVLSIINTSPVFTVAGTPPSLCNLSDGSITISGLNASTNYTVSYSDDGTSVASAPFTSSGAGTIQITGLNAGVYNNFTVTLVSSGCTGTSATTVTLINPGAPVITDLADQAVCDTYTLPAIVITGTATSQGYYTATNGGGAPLAVSSAVTSTQTIYIYAINGLCFDEETVTITVNNTPAITITDPAAVCTPATVDLTAAAVTAGSTNLGTMTYWSNAAATVAVSTPSSVSASGTYYIQSANGSCTNIQPVNVVVNATPVLTITNPASVCSPATADITAAAVTAGSTNATALTYWNDAAATSTLATPSAISTSNTYYIQATNAGCTDIAPVVVIVNPIPTAPTAGTDSLYCSSWALNDMTVNGTGGTYTWYSDNTLITVLGTGSSQSPIDVNGISNYYVTETVAGCESPADMVTIIIEDCEIIVPTAFTPDADGVHDYWEIVDLDQVYPDNVVTVYNRWGAKLYESEKGNYASEPWEGKFEGKVLPVGSYYFIIYFNLPDVEPMKGIVTIILE
jgi:gliding motility-associated-like protein